MNFNIRNTNLFYLICVPVVGVSVFDIATKCAGSGSTSAWAHIITALIFLLSIVLMYIYIQSISDSKTCFDLAKSIFGDFISKLFLIIYTLFYIIIGGLYVFYYASTLTDWLNSPINVHLVCALLISIASVCAHNGIKNIIRIFSLLGFISLTTLIIVRIIMLFKSEVINLLPIFEPDVYIENFGSIFTNIIPYFFPVGVILFMPIHKRDINKNIVGAFTGVILSALIMILVVAVCYGLIGVDGTAENRNAIVISMQLFDTRSIEFISRFDLLFIITWINFILMTLSLLFYIPVQSCFHLNYTGKPYIPCIVIGVLWFIISLFPENNIIASNAINLTIYILASLALIIIPLTILLGVMIKKCIKKHTD